MHDYFSGMICLRDGGTQMPDMVKRYTNKGIFTVYNIFVCLLLLLVGAVFIYTHGDIAATQVFNFSGAANATSTWVIYGVYLLPSCDRIPHRQDNRPHLPDLRRHSAVLGNRRFHRPVCQGLSPR